jgi:plasmid stability protein
MATITIRNLPDEVRDRMRSEAARNGRSMEEEARQYLARGYRPRLTPEEARRKLDALNAGRPPLPANAKMDGTDAFLAAKRIDLLFEEGLIPLSEKNAWDARIERYEVALDEVQAFFDKLWPWTAKS